MFTHLHVHTEYSLLDGLCRIPQLVSKAKEMGLESLAITDHGSMYGVVEFYRAATEAGIKPIIGCELYVAPASRRSRTAADKNPYHVVLLAKDDEGYRNLLQLCTRGHLEGFYYKPRVDKELLQQYRRGLVALSACLQGEVPRLIAEGRIHDARDSALWYKNTFGGDFYLEIQRHPIPELQQVNEVLLSFSKELDIPVVATNDVHYVEKEQASDQDLLLCIQTNSYVQDDRRLKMAGDFFYLRSPQEMEELYSDISQALENAGLIAQQCNLEIAFDRLHLPEVGLPEGNTADEYLAELCWQGLEQRYADPSPEVRSRLEYELDVVRYTQFAHYFLVVWDIVDYARRQHILCGVRGSAAASLVLYCLGVTDVDPLKYKLVFERFLNVERKEMPDIDLDFQDDRRDEVISYVAQKYGQDHVAQIITFGTLGARAALRDVGRALAMPHSQVDQVARMVPMGPSMTLRRALDENPEFRQAYQDDQFVRKLVDTAMKVEGVSRHASTHAAGVVISKEPLVNHVPLQQVTKSEAKGLVMAQFPMEDIARVGLLKMDLLGLANLTILAKAKELIARSTGTDINLSGIPMDDAKTFEMLSAGETSGVFQLEGSGMRRYLKELKPACFNDVAAMVALYRPGPMDHIPTFIRAKEGLQPIQYPHPALAEILEETHGVIVYQDQVLFIVQTFAGYSLGQADIVRKAMGKKVPEIMQKERSRFLEGARKKGFSAETAEEVFSLIEPFAGYAFNKAHSVSYAMIAYQTAYLKANYPVEYMCALLEVHSGQQQKVAVAVAECQRLGVTVLLPDVNRSELHFSRNGDGERAIRFGLADIKNVGENAVALIVQARESGGAFRSLDDFCRRVDLRGMNKRVMESLVKAGALDSLGKRGALLNRVDRILWLSQQEQKLRQSGQSTMFDLWGESTTTPLPQIELDEVDIPQTEKLSWEKEMLGVYLSEHPFAQALRDLDADATAFCGQIEPDMAGQAVSLAGLVSSARHGVTKTGRSFVTATLEDLTGSIEVTCWAERYQQTKDLWQEGNALLVQGRVRMRQDEVQLVCDGVQQYTSEDGEAVEQPEAETETPAETGERKSGRVLVTIQQTSDEEGDLERFRLVWDTVRSYRGDDEVLLSVATRDGLVNVEMPNAYTRYCTELHQDLVGLVGEEGVRLQDNPWT